MWDDWGVPFLCPNFEQHKLTTPFLAHWEAVTLMPYVLFITARDASELTAAQPSNTVKTEGLLFSSA